MVALQKSGSAQSAIGFIRANDSARSRWPSRCWPHFACPFNTAIRFGSGMNTTGLRSCRRMVRNKLKELDLHCMRSKPAVGPSMEPAKGKCGTMFLRLEVVLLVILIAAATGAEMAPVCPQGCDCDDIMMVVNCTGAGLKRIPDSLPRNYHIFAFDNNALGVVRSDDLDRINRTRLLSLSRCNITKIQDGAFNWIGNVSELYLAGNRLDAVPREVRNLGRLQLLDLTGNSIDRLAKYSFAGLSRLQTLLLDDNNITVLFKGCMSDATRLRVLSLRRNGIHTVQHGSFHCLESVEELYLSDNSFRNLPPAWLVGLFKLRVLDLRRAYSADAMFDQWPDDNATTAWLFPGLSPLLESLDLAENGLTGLGYNAFLTLKEMTRLDLSVNQLSELPLGVFSRQRKLRYLDLSYNQLTNLTNVLFSEDAELEYLSLGNNRLETLGPDTFKHVQNLRYLDLQRNVLYDIESIVKSSLPNLQEVNLIANAISNISSTGFTSFKKLRKIYLKNNRLTAVPNVRNLTFLTHLDLSWNGITSVAPDAFLGATNLREINLQNNYITTLNERTLVGLPRLGAVRVGNNPWKCDCRLEWFGQASQNEDWGLDLDDAICEWPPSMKNTRVVLQDKDVQCTTYPPPAYVIILVVIWIAVLLIVATAVLVRTYNIHRTRSRRMGKDSRDPNLAQQADPQAYPAGHRAAKTRPDQAMGRGKGKGKEGRVQVIEMKDMKSINGLKVKPFDREFYV